MAVDMIQPGLKRWLGFGLLTLYGIGVVSAAGSGVALTWTIVS